MDKYYKWIRQILKGSREMQSMSENTMSSQNSTTNVHKTQFCERDSAKSIEKWTALQGCMS